MSDSTDTRKLPDLKLPRKIEDDLRRSRIVEVLREGLQPLWEKSPYRISELPWSPIVERALSNALRAKKLELGIETIERVLEIQKRGLEALQQKQGTESVKRVSRILIVSMDGSERLFRSCESLLTKHGERLLCLRFAVPAAEMGEKIFGPDRAIKVILVTDREHVENLLFALADA